MAIINICESVKCPYLGKSGKNYYGCQRYVYSCGCHLRHIQKFASSEYILYVQDSEPVDVEALQRENNKWLNEDPKYHHDLEFQAAYPELFEGDCFKLP